MNTGCVQDVCVSTKKGVPKSAVNEVRVIEDHGIDGDAHAGPWHRQISLLTARDIYEMRAKGLDLAPGAFGENFVVDGIGLDALGIGSRLCVGDGCELELTQLGKVCHTRCAIYHKTGDCIMPRLGVFARVLRGGTVRLGDSIQAVSTVDPSAIQVAIVGVAEQDTNSDIEDVVESVVSRVGGLEGCRVAYVGQCARAKAMDVLLHDLAGRPMNVVASIHAATASRRWLAEMRGVVPIHDASLEKDVTSGIREERGSSVFRLRNSLLTAVPCDAKHAEESIRAAVASVIQQRIEARS